MKSNVITPSRGFYHLGRKMAQGIQLSIENFQTWEDSIAHCERYALAVKLDIAGRLLDLQEGRFLLEAGRNPAATLEDISLKLRTSLARTKNVHDRLADRGFLVWNSRSLADRRDNPVFLTQKGMELAAELANAEPARTNPHLHEEVTETV